MNETNNLFPGQEKDEKVFQTIRKHWFVFAPSFLVVLVMVIPVFIAPFVWANFFINGDYVTVNFVIISLSIYLLVVLASSTMMFIDLYFDVYFITDKRIVDISQVELFKREISELHLHQVQDVNARVEGFFATLFNFGNVYIQSAGERENFIFSNVPNAYIVAKNIADLHEAQIEGKNMDSLFKALPVPQKPKKVVVTRKHKKILPDHTKIVKYEDDMNDFEYDSGKPELLSKKVETKATSSDPVGTIEAQPSEDTIQPAKPKETISNHQSKPTKIEGGEVHVLKEGEETEIEEL